MVIHEEQQLKRGNAGRLNIPFPSFLPSPFMRRCAILPTSFWGDDWSHSLHRRFPSWGFPGFSSSVRQMPRDLCTAPCYISLLPVSLVDRSDWRDTRGKLKAFLAIAHGSMDKRQDAWQYTRKYTRNSTNSFRGRNRSMMAWWWWW